MEAVRTEILGLCDPSIALLTIEMCHLARDLLPLADALARFNTRQCTAYDCWREFQMRRLFAGRMCLSSAKFLSERLPNGVCLPDEIEGLADLLDESVPAQLCRGIIPHIRFHTRMHSIFEAVPTKHMKTMRGMKVVFESMLSYESELQDMILQSAVPPLPKALSTDHPSIVLVGLIDGETEEPAIVRLCVGTG